MFGIVFISIASRKPTAMTSPAVGKQWHASQIILPTIHSDSTEEGSLVNREAVSQTNTTNDSCQQTWTYYANGACVCGSDIHSTVQCRTDTRKVSIAGCNCMTLDDIDGVVVGKCLYGCGFTAPEDDVHYHSLPTNISELNGAMCGRLHRDGRLCHKCHDTFSPLAYSYDLKCIKCTDSNFDNWLKFIAIAFIPLTIFYFIVILFRINATTPYIYGFISANQIVALPMHLRAVIMFLREIPEYSFVARLTMVHMAMWNLDFFRSLTVNICLELSMLQILFLDYAIALYPFVLLIVTYVLIELHARGCVAIAYLWRPFQVCFARLPITMDTRPSIVKAFATLLLFSYVKLLNTTMITLLPVVVYNAQQQIVGVYVYYDASYEYFSKEHLPYALMGIFVFLVFVLFPLILFCLYPTSCFQRCLTCCNLNSHKLRTFIDTFQGHFKDGTEPGSRDYRWFAAVNFLVRIIVSYICYAIVEDITIYTLAAIGGIILGVLMILLQPYKSQGANTYHSLLALSLSLGCLLATIVYQQTAKARWIYDTAIYLLAVITNLPILIAVAYVVYYICRPCMKKCHSHENGINAELRRLLESHSQA